MYMYNILPNNAFARIFLSDMVSRLKEYSEISVAPQAYVQNSSWLWILHWQDIWDNMNYSSSLNTVL